MDVPHLSDEERARLDAAYRATTYRVGKLGLRIGEPHPQLDLVLEARGLTDYTYLTAANPLSRQLHEDDNRRRMRDLVARVGAMGLQHLRGASYSDDGEWPPEPSILVLGLEEAGGIELGREFGQNAVVVGRVGGAPELRWLR